VKLKFRLGYDDALDVVGVHFVGGLVGSVLVGVFADPDFFGAEFGKGLIFGGGFSLLGEQLLANGVTIVYSFLVTLVLMVALDKTIGVRVRQETEEEGLDYAEHGETAYHAMESSLVRS
jgi:Amt family ammonium transporter